MACVLFVATCGLGAVSLFADVIDVADPLPTITLGAAGNFAVLEIGCSANSCTPAVPAGSVTNSNVTIIGNQGVGFGGSINNMAPSHIMGDVVQYQANQITGSIDSGTPTSHITGSILVQPDVMDQAYLDSINAFNTVKNLPASPGQTFGTGGTSNLGVLNITGSSGLNVIQLNGTINDTVNLTGPADAYFVINVTGNLNISGSEIAGNLSGGVTAQHVLWNFITPGTSLASMVGNQVNGTLLAPFSTFSGFHGAFGAIISGMSGSLMSSATVTQAPFSGFFPAVETPEPGTLAMMGMGLIGLFSALRRRKQAALS
jgi:hypothetical protein